MKKNCRICTAEIEVKKNDTNVYCAECKQTDEYKEIKRIHARKVSQTKKVNGFQVCEKICKICNEKFTTIKSSTWLYCEKCKSTDQYLDYVQKIEQKRQQSCMKKHGVHHVFCVDDIVRKKEETNLKKYGVRSTLSLQETKNKIAKTNIFRYGVANPLASKKFLERRQHDFSKYWSFSKPHQLLKKAIDENLEHDFITEAFVTIGQRHFSIDELDRKRKIVVFVDGDYWHANPYKYEENHKIKGVSAKQIWQYDLEVTSQLEKVGYLVLRFWEKDIYENLSQCIEKIKQAVEQIDCYQLSAAS